MMRSAAQLPCRCAMPERTKNMSQRGSVIWCGLRRCPLASVMASTNMLMNFWPSCAPCMNATPAPEAICAQRKNRDAFPPVQVAAENEPSQLGGRPPEARSPATVDNGDDRTRTFIHSAPLMPPRPPCSAMAAPVRPAMSEWLCAGGDAEEPRRRAPHDDGDHGGARAR